jgi:hypothetical protein
MPDPSDFFGAAIVTPGWILLGAALGIHGIWRHPMSAARIAGISLYGVVGLILSAVSWWYGAAQIQTARIAQKAQIEIETQSVADQKELRERLKQADERLRQMQLSVDRLALSGPTIAVPPPNLSQSDRARLIPVLAPFAATAAKVQIGSSQDGRAYLYAQQWHSLLREAGWKVEAAITTIVSAPPLVGITIVVASPQTPGAGVLQHAFESVGVAAKGIINEHAAAELIDLTFGAQ